MFFHLYLVWLYFFGWGLILGICVYDGGEEGEEGEDEDGVEAGHGYFVKDALRPRCWQG